MVQGGGAGQGGVGLGASGWGESKLIISLKS